MLVNCKECGLQISDKAIFCPHCGLPIRPDKISRSYKLKKLPNGFGQITKLKNQNLRNPYRVMVTVGHTESGRPISKILKPKGYFATYKEAYEALIENAKNPYEAIKDMTVEQVYESWSSGKFENISESMQNQYKLAWSYCQSIKDVKFALIKPKNIKDLMHQEGLPATLPKLIRILFNNLFDYAIENDITDKNYSRLMKYKQNTVIAKGHQSFTNEEIDALWENISVGIAKWILIQCYTGMRPGELCDLKLENIFLEDNYMIGGNKTENGKNRIIPIHPEIKYLIAEQKEEALKSSCKNLLCGKFGRSISYDWYNDLFKATCKKISLTEGHRAHDPRVFFVSKAKEYHVDEYAIKLIVGHSIKDITEKVYTKRTTEWLYQEICKIKCTSNVRTY